MIEVDRLVPDTNIIIENLLSDRIKKKEIKVQEILIHEAVIAELEHQANLGKSIGHLGLDELKNLHKLSKGGLFELKFEGRRPSAVEIKHASIGEVDALIRELAYNQDATLLTADKVQAEVAEAKGMKVIYIEPTIKKRKLTLEKFFDENTMSVHLRENIRPFAKKGLPGEWKFTPLSEEILTKDVLQEISKEIVEEAKMRRDCFIESERKGSTIIQLGNYRIVMTRPPFSDAYEITAVRPIKKLNIEEYKLSNKLRERIETKAEGMLIAGAPGHGKTTFAGALAEYFTTKDKIVKTIESPRDLQLTDNITQYSINYGTMSEIYDVLLLSRPDYAVFDEMRNTEDFKLFADLRLSGIGLVGVVHSSEPIDAIQRFIGRAELGTIPHIIDTVLFIKNGFIHKVLSITMVVKVPHGMTEADLARPLIEVRDFENNKLEYEIYSYGEETVVIPVIKEKLSPAKLLAAKQIEKEISKITTVKAELTQDHKAIIYVPEKDIPKVIGRAGKNIELIEKKLGIAIDVRPIEEKDAKKEIAYNVNENANFITFYTSNKYSGKIVDIYLEDEFLFSGVVSKRGEIKVHKRSQLGKTLIESLDSKKKIILRL